MKKIFAILIMMFIITGCGNNSNTENVKSDEDNKNINKEYTYITCINESKTDIIANKTEAKVYYENDEVKKVEYTFNLIKDNYSLAKTLNDEYNKAFKDIKGVSSTIDNDKIVRTINFENINLEDYKVSETKYEKFISSSIEPDFSFIIDNKISLQKFKETQLEDYKCN